MTLPRLVNPESPQGSAPLNAGTIAKLIAAAWADAKPPVGPLACSLSEEGVGVEQEFKGRRWQELTPTFVDQAPDGWGTALSFMSDEAFLYYIPAYLIADVQGFLVRSEPVFRLTEGFDGTAYGQRPYADPDRVTFWSQLNLKQIEAVVAYLHFAAADVGWSEQCQAALESYWLPRLESMLGQKDSDR